MSNTQLDRIRQEIVSESEETRAVADLKWPSAGIPVKSSSSSSSD